MLRSSARLFSAATLLAVIALTLAGCGGATGDLTFDDEAYPFSFSYPGTWTLARNVTTAGADSGSAQNSVSVALKEPYDQVTISEFKLKKKVPTGENGFKPEVDRIVKEMVSQAQGKVSDAKPVEIDDARGYEYVISYPAGSVQLESRLTLLFKDDSEFQVNCQSSAENRDELNSGCDQILDSLKIS